MLELSYVCQKLSSKCECRKGAFASSDVRCISFIGTELNRTLFLQIENQTSAATDVINMFSKASGLDLNINKCGLMDIKDCSKSDLCNISIRNGSTTNKQTKKTVTLNFNPLLQRFLILFIQSEAPKKQGVHNQSGRSFSAHLRSIGSVRR